MDFHPVESAVNPASLLLFPRVPDSIDRSDVIIQEASPHCNRKGFLSLPIEIVDKILSYVPQQKLEDVLHLCFAHLYEPKSCLQAWVAHLPILKYSNMTQYNVTIDRYEDNPFVDHVETIRIQCKNSNGKLFYQALIKEYPAPYTIELHILDNDFLPRSMPLDSLHSITLLNGESDQEIYSKARRSTKLREICFLNAGSSTLKFLHYHNLKISTIYFFVNDDSPKKNDRFKKVVTDWTKPLPQWMKMGLSTLHKTIQDINFVTIKPHLDENEKQFWVTREHEKLISGSGKWDSWEAKAVYYTFHCAKEESNFDRLEFAKYQVEEFSYFED